MPLGLSGSAPPLLPRTFGQAVASMLRERGLYFEEVTWVASDTFKQSGPAEWRAGKLYLMGQLGAALSSNEVQILDSLRDRQELEKQLSDFQVEYTAKGNMTLNAAAGSHDDYVAALALAWFGVQNCARSLGPPRTVRW